MKTTDLFGEDERLMARLDPIEKQKFIAWFDELNILNHKSNKAYYSGQNLEESTGIDCWYGYFDDEYTPQEALDEDLKQGL